MRKLICCLMVIMGVLTVSAQKLNNPILGGELSNSASTSVEDIDEVMPRMRALGLNTVLVPAYWEFVEPEEGQFDFTLIDHTIDVARLGYSATESVPVYDIWAGEDLGTATGTISTIVPSHGVKLFRLGEKATTDIQDATNLPSFGGVGGGPLIYNLQGQRVGAEWKGIQIQNGKKRLQR